MKYINTIYYFPVYFLDNPASFFLSQNNSHARFLLHFTQCAF